MVYIFSDEDGYYNFTHHVWQDDLTDDCLTTDILFANGIATANDATVYEYVELER